MGDPALPIARFWQGLWRGQADRWPLLFPLAMMAGAGVFMAAPQDPPVWLGLALCGAGAGAVWGLTRPSPQSGRLRQAGAVLAGLVVCFGLGLAAGQWRVFSVSAPRLPALLDETLVTGVVEEAIQGPTRPRIVVRVTAVEGVATPPKRVSLSTLPGAAFPPGRAVQCRARLEPPDGPQAPHLFDAARRAYFTQVGASGFTLGRCWPIAAPEGLGDFAQFELRLAAWRRALSEAVYAMAPHDGGAIAVAMITGDRSFMSEAAVLAFRDSGLGHALSVSGLHMSLVGGGVFAALWFVLALIPRLALFAPIKKIAAVAAIVALAAYLVISGASVPAVRAFIMAIVAFGAVLIDRPALSMRGLAAALALVVLLTPEAVLEPGFQMSFAATGALVAYFETRTPQRAVVGDVGVLIGAVQGSWRAIAGVLGISLVAGLATDPFAIFHFQRLAVYGLPANLAAAPLLSFLAAPAALAAAVLAPFGWAEPAIDLMANALLVVAGIGNLFATRPEAVTSLPTMEPLAFGWIVGGMIWMCLWRGVLRWFGALGLVTGAALYVAQPGLEAAFDGEGRAVAAAFKASERGPLWGAVRAGRQGDFWVERLGGLAGIAPRNASLLAAPPDCQPNGKGAAACRWTAPSGRVYGWAPTIAAAQVLCGDKTARPTLVFLLADADAATRSACAGIDLMDAADRRAHGGGLIRATPLGFPLRVERARAWAGARPWTGTLGPPPQPASPMAAPPTGGQPPPAPEQGAR
jgi:competence protein ComEC